MELHTSEQEQVEALKKWWHENKNGLIVGLVIGIGAVVGYRSWLDYNERIAKSASDTYEKLMVAVTGNNSQDIATHAGTLVSQYSGTPYAALGALMLAKSKVESGDLAAAAQQLRWAMDNADQDEVAHVARLRLGRVLLSDGKADEALALVKGVNDKAFASGYEELRGDIYLAQGQRELARTAYGQALATLPASANNREMLQMKLDDLGRPVVVVNSDN